MKVILKTLLTLALIGAALTFYTYHQPHKSMSASKADFTMEATTLFTDFEQDESKANDKYLDKIVEVSGIVKEVNTENDQIISVSLESQDGMFGVICQLDEHTKHKRSDFKEGEKVSFKGVCTGMLMDVVLVRCVEI